MKKLTLALTLFSTAAFATAPSPLQILQDRLAVAVAQNTLNADLCAAKVSPSQLQIDQCAAQAANGKVQVDQINAQIAALSQ